MTNMTECPKILCIHIKSNSVWVTFSTLLKSATAMAYTYATEFAVVALLVIAQLVATAPQAEKKYDQCSHPFHSFLCNPAPKPRNIATAASNGIKVIDPPPRLPAASFGVKTISPAPAGSLPVPAQVQPPCEHEATSPRPQKPPLLGASSFARESKLPPVAYLPPKTREGSASSPAKTFIQPANLDPPFVAPKPSYTFPQPAKTFPEYKRPSAQTPKPAVSDKHTPDCEHSSPNKSFFNQPSPANLAGSSTFQSPAKAIAPSSFPLIPATTKPTPNYNPFLSAAQNQQPVVAPFPAPAMMRPKICDDVFHSFLCQPVDPSKRKQKYGQLPAGSAPIKGDSSFVQPSKVLPPTTNKPSYFTTSPPALIGSSFQYLSKSNEPPCNHSDPVSRNYPVLKPDSSFTQQVQVPRTTKRPTTTTTTTSKPFYPILKANSYPKPESTFQVQSKLPPPCNGSESKSLNQGNKPFPVQYQTTTKRPTTTTARTTTTTTTTSRPFSFGFSGESSFQSPSKVAPPCNHSTPTNNFFQQYFTPHSTSAPATTRRPTTTTTTTTTTLTPFFFQPKGASTFQSQLKVPPPCNHTKAQPSDPFQQFLRPSTTTTTTRKPTPTTTTTTTPFPFFPRGESTFQSSVKVSPPCNDTSHNFPVPKPDSTFLTQSIVPLPTINRPTNADPAYKPQAAEISSVTVDGHGHDHDHHHHGKDICKDPFHSFLCIPVTPSKRKRPTGEIPERLRNAFPNGLSGASSFNNPTKVLPSTTPRPLVPPNPQQSQINPFRIFSSPPITTTPVPCEHESHLPPKGSSTFLQSSRVPLTGHSILPQATAQKPSYTSDSPFKAVSQQFSKSVNPDRIPQSTNNSPQGYNYPRPPDGTGQGSSIQDQGYNYPKPSQQFPTGASTFQQPTKVAAPDRIAQGTANSQQGYSYPKPPENFGEGTAPQPQGYNYPKPSQQFPFGASSFQQPTKTAPPDRLALGTTNTQQGYSYPKPPQSIGEDSSPQQHGYNYPKPANSFLEFGSLKPAATNNANPIFAPQKPDCEQDNSPSSRTSPSQFVRRYRGTQSGNFFGGRKK